MTKARREIPEVIRVAIWRDLLDGASIAEIARYSHQAFLAAGIEYDECTPTQVRKVLSESPPPEILEDLRYIYSVRAFWIASQGELAEGLGSAEGMVIAFQPWRITTIAFQKGVRAIVKDFRANCIRGDIDPYIIESVEMDAALRMVHDRGYAAWLIDVDGKAARYAGEFASDKDLDPESPTP